MSLDVTLIVMHAIHSWFSSHCVSLLFLPQVERENEPGHDNHISPKSTNVALQSRVHKNGRLNYQQKLSGKIIELYQKQNTQSHAQQQWLMSMHSCAVCLVLVVNSAQCGILHSYTLLLQPPVLMQYSHCVSLLSLSFLQLGEENQPGYESIHFPKEQ